MGYKDADAVLNSTQTGLSPTQKLLLAILGRYAQDGVAWPAVSRLSERLEVSERSVQRTLRELEAQGFLSDAGTRRNNVRAWHVRDRQGVTQAVTPASPPTSTPTSRGDTSGDASVTPSDPGGDASVAQGVTPVSPRGDASVTQTSKNRSLEPISTDVGSNGGHAGEVKEITDDDLIVTAAEHRYNADRAVALSISVEQLRELDADFKRRTGQTIRDAARLTAGPSATASTTTTEARGITAAASRRDPDG